MKKSNIINLVLVATITAACGKKEEDWEGGGGSNRKVYLRSDTTAVYTKSEQHQHSYHAFRAYSSSGGSGSYSRRTGYYSDGIHYSSNVGHNTTKGGE
ncbi:hypothetical protein JJC04_14330 [Flavobacterium covae]|nr:hypothetical protein [Flavobacterium covae]QYS90998.1 hypothetical protein JJC04_14330 [Flavobacterium covae]